MTTPYAPAYPFDTHPSGLAGRLTAALRFHPEADHSRTEEEVTAGKIALYVSRAMRDLGRPLPADLAETVLAVMTGDAK